MKKIGKEKIIIFALAYLVLNIILFAVFKDDKANISVNILVRQSRQSGVARATSPD